MNRGHVRRPARGGERPLRARRSQVDRGTPLSPVRRSLAEAAEEFDPLAGNVRLGLVVDEK
jgi:hypothetical protein